MKKMMFLSVGFLVLGVSAVTYLASHSLATRLAAKNTAVQPCTGLHTSHVLTIAGGQMRPAHIDAARCDTLAIVNQDSVTRLFAFGEHNHHYAVDGVVEKILRVGDSFTVTLTQAGSFTYHDHLNDQVRGTLTVTP